MLASFPRAYMKERKKRTVLLRIKSYEASVQESLTFFSSIPYKTGLARKRKKVSRKEDTKAIKAFEEDNPHHQTPILIPKPSPLTLIGAGLGALLGGLLLLMLLLPPAPIVGGKGNGVEGGGAGGPRPTTGMPKSSAGSEVRGL